MKEYFGDIVSNVREAHSEFVLLVKGNRWALYQRNRKGSYERIQAPLIFTFYDPKRNLVAIVECEKIIILIWRRGPRGPRGHRGPIGLSGISGISGLSGISGTPGLSGISGTPGLSGVSGISGTPGLSGVSGISGTPGLSGILSTISGAYGDVYNLASFSQTISGGGGNSTLANAIIFSNSGPTLGTTYSQKGLIIDVPGEYEAQYKIVVDNTRAGIAQISLGDTRAGVTTIIPGSTQFGQLSIVGSVIFPALAGDLISILNTGINPLTLTSMPVSAAITATAIADNTDSNSINTTSSTIHVTAGQSVYVFVQWDASAGVAITSITDDQTGTFTLIDFSTLDTGVGSVINIAAYYRDGVTADGTYSVSVTFSATTNSAGLEVLAFTPTITPSLVLGSQGALATTQPGGTSNIMIPVTPTAADQLVLGGVAIYANSLTTTLAAGTSGIPLSIIDTTSSDLPSDLYADGNGVSVAPGSTVASFLLTTPDPTSVVGIAFAVNASIPPVPDNAYLVINQIGS